MHTKLILAVSLLVLITGCATTANTQLSADGSNTHSYDGWWTATLLKTPRSQFSGDWVLSCADSSGEFAFEVAQSRVVVKLLGQVSEQPLDERGRFEIRQATSYSVSETPSSDLTIGNGNVTLVFKGNLSRRKPKGSLTHLISGLGDGCRTTAVFTRVEDPA